MISIAREGCRKGVDDAVVSTYISLLGLNLGQLSSVARMVFHGEYS